MLIYNEIAFRQLRSLLFKQQLLRSDTNEGLRAYMTQLNPELAISEPTFYKWFLKQKIPFCRLILLCNLTRFPLALFFAWQPDEEDNTHVLPQRYYRIVPEQDWIPIRVRLDYMINDMHIHCRLSRQEIGQLYGIKSSYHAFAYNLLDELGKITLEFLLGCLQDKRLTPSLYLIDYNERFPMDHTNSVFLSQENRLYSQVDVLHSENNTLQQKVQNLTNKLEKSQKTIQQKDEKINELKDASLTTINKFVQVTIENTELREEIKKLNQQLYNRGKYEKSKSKKNQKGHRVP